LQGADVAKQIKQLGRDGKLGGTIKIDEVKSPTPLTETSTSRARSQRRP